MSDRRERRFLLRVKSVLMSTETGRFVSARVSRRGGICVRQGPEFNDRDIIPFDGLDCF